jgi:Tol biopolymer transport system component
MKVKLYFLFAVLIFTGCAQSVRITGTIDGIPGIFPDYTDVIIPENIAPLNFKLVDKDYSASFLFIESETKKIPVKGRNGSFVIPLSEWRGLLEESKGKSLKVTVCVEIAGEWKSFRSFYWHVANEPIDPYLAYRLIAPGYTLWNEMGIYQRQLSDYKQYTVIENKMTGTNCLNCHSFCNRDPDRMLFHMRKTYPGTYMIDGERIEKLNTKTDHTLSALVYPSWHPSGKYVAFTVNDTKQAFHMNDPNRLEVFDMASDVLVYDVDAKTLITVPHLFSKQRYETFPTFSPDGKTLYFCTAGVQDIPDDFEKVKYSLCAISFDPEKKTFGETVDTLYNAEAMNKSVALPRVSPDGRFLLYTLSSYGNFFIWHKDADLYMIDLAENRRYPLREANSDYAESYHSWSGNSRWIVFSSRRTDGLYTQPFFSYIDENGHAGKPFLLPQKDAEFYHKFMKSYNIPEFVKGRIGAKVYDIVDVAKNDRGANIRFTDTKNFPTSTPAENIAH